LRDHLVAPAGDVVDPDEISRAEILDQNGVEWGPSVTVMLICSSTYAARSSASIAPMMNGCRSGGTMMRPIFAFAALVLAVVSPHNFCFAQPTGQYAFNIPKTNPESFVAWRRILPVPLHAEPWIFRLEGTASPYTTVTVNGRRHLYGWFCKPHECGTNRVAFLMAEDGSRATGLYVLGSEPNARQVFLGNPTPEEIVLLRAMAR
jgi:hypothetical protein